MQQECGRCPQSKTRCRRNRRLAKAAYQNCSSKCRQAGNIISGGSSDSHCSDNMDMALDVVENCQQHTFLRVHETYWLCNVDCAKRSLNSASIDQLNVQIVLFLVSFSCTSDKECKILGLENGPCCSVYLRFRTRCLRSCVKQSNKWAVSRYCSRTWYM